MPSEKRALDNDYDRSAKKPKRDGDDQPRDWRAAYFEDGSSKRRQKDHDPRDKGLDRDRQRDRSYDRPRDKERSHRPGHEPHSASSTQRNRDQGDPTGRAPPIAPKAMLQPSGNDEREEGEYVIYYSKRAFTDFLTRISPRPTE